MSDLQVRGPQLGATGTAVPFNAGPTGGQRVQDAHGRYFDPTFYKRMFQSASASYTLVAGSAVGQAFATLIQPLCFWNPVGSNTLAVIQRCVTGHISGTPAGPLLYTFAMCNTRVSSAATGTIRSCWLSDQNAGQSKMMPLNAVIVASIPADTTTVSLDLGPCGGPAAVAIATGSGNFTVVDDVAGAIIVPPGCVFGIGCVGAGTSHVVRCSLYWEEVPLLL